MTPDEAFDLVRADPTQRAVLRAARSWGVAPSVFLGRGPRLDLVVTARDAAGRPARYVDTRPEWDDDDRVLALALEAYDADICAGCGFPLSESTTPAREYSYTAGAAIRCHACTAHAQESAKHSSKSDAAALRIPVTYKRSTFEDRYTEEGGSS